MKKRIGKIEQKGTSLPSVSSSRYFGGSISYTSWKPRRSLFGEDYYYSSLSGGSWGDRYGVGGSSLLNNYSRFIDYSDLKNERDILRKGIVKVKELIAILNIPKKVFIRVSPLIGKTKAKASTDDDDDEEGTGCSTFSSWVDDFSHTTELRKRYLQGTEFDPDRTGNEYVSLYLQTKVLEDSEMTTQDKINVITAEGIHECAHILYTHQRTLNDFLVSIPKIVKKWYRKSLKTSSVNPALLNLLEKITDTFKIKTGFKWSGYEIGKIDEVLKLAYDYKLASTISPEGITLLDHTTNTGRLLFEKELWGLQEICHLVYLFANVIENNRVDGLLTQERPGVSEHLDILKNYKTSKIGKLIKDMFNSDIKGIEECPELIENILLTIVGGEKSKDLDFSLKDRLLDILRPSKSTLDSCRLAVEVFKLLDNWALETFDLPFQKLLYCKDEYCKERDGLPAPLSGLGKLASMFNTGSSSLDDNLPTEEEEGNKEGSSNPSDSDKEEGDGDYEVDGIPISRKGKSSSDSDLKNYLTSLATNQISKSLTEKGKYLVQGELNGLVTSQEAIDGNTINFYEINQIPISSSKEVQNMKKRATLVSSYSSVLKKSILGKFKNKKFKYYGCKSGTLDPAKIVEAYQGVESVYTQPAEYITSKVVLILLLDESGSMGLESDPKVDLVKKAAALLISAFGNSKYVDLYVYGHSADINQNGDTDIFVYKEGSKETDKTLVDIDKMSYVQGRYENRDGTAIYEIAKRVDKKAYKCERNSDKKTIMVVLSDGEPCAYSYHGLTGIEDTRKKVTEAQKEFGTQIVQCTVEDVRYSEKMFDTVIKLEEDLPGFVGNITRVINNLLEKNITTKIIRY